MNILQSWKQSLSLFSPANFVQFMGDVARSIVETYKVLLRNWYVLLIILPVVIVDMCIGIYFQVSSIAGHTLLMRTKYNGIIIWDNGDQYGTVPIFDFLLYVLYVCFVMVICLVARASTQQKNWTYFKSYALFFVRLGLLIGIVAWVGESLENGSALTPSGQEILFASKFAPLYMLFYLDSNGSFKSLLGSFGSMIAFVLYNVPLMVILIGLLIAVPEFVNMSFWSSVSFYLAKPMTYFFFWPVLAAFWANIYTRIRREQPELYRD